MSVVTYSSCSDDNVSNPIVPVLPDQNIVVMYEKMFIVQQMDIPSLRQQISMYENNLHLIIV